MASSLRLPGGPAQLEGYEQKQRQVRTLILKGKINSTKKLGPFGKILGEDRLSPIMLQMQKKVLVSEIDDFRYRIHTSKI